MREQDNMFETNIGLEVHLQLKTSSKIFCSCSALFSLEPNSRVCPVCAGFPGVMPVLNREASFLALRAALALNCRIREVSLFARKQYFYPDLPKNFQISQYDQPLAEDGFLEIKVGREKKRVGITRVHLEEDAGKLLHFIGSLELSESLVDLNRSGLPLLEIVSEPHLNSPEDAYGYLTRLKDLLLYMEVSDCNMEEGSLRCDANISLRPREQKNLGVKSEIKNMNSFRAVKKALSFEVKRQTEILSRGQRVVQETRLWDEKEEETRSMRSKEEACDYRYFPEPDLMPLVFTREEINRAKEDLPEDPEIVRKRLGEEYNLNEYDIAVLSARKDMISPFLETLRIWGEKRKLGGADYKFALNIYSGIVKEQLNAAKKTFSQSPLTGEYLAGMLGMIDRKEISLNQAKQMVKKDMGSPEKLRVPRPDFGGQISDEDNIRELVQKAIAENRDVASRLAAGDEKPLGFLVGMIMRASGGRANPRIVNKILKEELRSGE